MQHCYVPEDIQHIVCLSWGLPGEVLLGGSKLALITTDDEIQESWKSPPLANACKLASFSHDASLVASTGGHDRLVKVWRRGFIGGGNERFDPVYLSHPGTVTSLKWRGRPRIEEHAEAVLYTTCSDGNLRVWTTIDPHCLHILELWSQLDLFSCIQPRSPLSPTPFKKRYVVIIDKWDFYQAVEDAAHRNNGGEREQHTRVHLREIVSNDPEVCMVLDDNGNMSAWGLERIGCKTRFGHRAMNIAHAENLGVPFPHGVTPKEDFAILRSFVSHSKDGSLDLLAHLFDGRIQWLSSPIERLFDPAPPPQCMRLKFEFTGHSQTIQCLASESRSRCIISLAEKGEILTWRQSESSITRQSAIACRSKILGMQILPGGDFAILMEESRISCWSLATAKASLVATTAFVPPHNACLSEPEGLADLAEVRLLVIGPSLQARVVVINIQPEVVKVSVGPELRITDKGIAMSGRVNGDIEGEAHMPDNVLAQPISASLVAIAEQGRGLQRFELRSQYDTDSLYFTKYAATALDSSLPGTIICNKTHTAIINSTHDELRIWNVWPGQCELSYSFEAHETIVAVRWGPRGHWESLLAVALHHRVIVFLPTGFEMTSRLAPWRLVSSTSLMDFSTLPLTDLTWTGKTNLMIAAGSQLFALKLSLLHMKDDSAAADTNASSQAHTTLESMIVATNTTLPVFHPQYILYLVLCGALLDAQSLLTKLHDRLKVWTEGDPLSSSVDSFNTTSLETNLNGYVNGHGTYSTVKHKSQDNGFDDETALALNERLASSNLPWLSKLEHQNLRCLCRATAVAWKSLSSVDGLGLTHLVEHQLHADPASRIMSDRWRMTTHAMLSNSQEVLLGNTLTTQRTQSFHWSAARKHHTTLWILPRETLLSHFEMIARAEYTKSEDRDPLDCSLFYLALRKKSVLQGLWRMAHGHREREQTMRVLAQDFDEPRWKTAALKNAYALLGRRRAMYAAAWFLLADEGKSAVNVLLGPEVNDLELAISVARVFDGDDGPVLKALVEDVILLQAVEEGDRWKAIYGCLILGRQDLALRACTQPLAGIFPNTQKSCATLEAQMWWKSDPSVIRVYTHLRDEWLKVPSRRNLRFPVSPKEESDAVRAAARTYMRMGCGWLALDLMRSWTFTNVTQDVGSTRVEAEGDATDSVEVTELSPSHQNERQMQERSSSPPASHDWAAGRKKVVEEPSASSILDSFDF